MVAAYYGYTEVIKVLIGRKDINLDLQVTGKLYNVHNIYIIFLINISTLHTK